MSTEKTDEQNAANEKIAARAAELKTYEGKTFKRKDGVGGLSKVIKYNGVMIHQESEGGKPKAVATHTFLVEGWEGRWTPGAAKFLSEHEEVATPDSSATNEVI